MRALITGGAGFIGSWLTEGLLARGYGVTCLDDLSSGNLSNLEPCSGSPDFRFVRGEVGTAPELPELVEESDVVFHLAAAVGVHRVMRQSVYVIENNFRATSAVLRVASALGRKVVLASSSEVYGQGVKLPFLEESETRFGLEKPARWSYAGGKILDEFLALSHHRESDLPVVVVRFFNVIGPRQVGSYGMVVPRFVEQALKGSPLTLYGSGRQTRCFCDVKDIVQMLISLSLEPAAVGQVFNMGSDREITIDALADLVLEVTASRSQKQFVPYETIVPPYEDVRRRIPDLAKLRKTIACEPNTELRESLTRVARHLKGPA